MQIVTFSNLQRKLLRWKTLMRFNFSMFPILTRGGKRMKPFMPKLVYFEPKALE
ncbi:spore photoproduct lyase, partial [Bacillus paranthracis]|nr:spore photoproduct lyase [Bacillus paranthracis]